MKISTLQENIIHTLLFHQLAISCSRYLYKNPLFNISNKTKVTAKTHQDAWEDISITLFPKIDTCRLVSLKTVTIQAFNGGHEQLHAQRRQLGTSDMFLKIGWHIWSQLKFLSTLVFSPHQVQASLKGGASERSCPTAQLLWGWYLQIRTCNFTGI